MIHLVVGPPGHGVVRHGRRLSAAGAGALVELATPHGPPPQLRDAAVLVQFTDRPFGRPATTAAAGLERLTGAARCVVVALHDLPQRSDGAARAVRTAGYLRVAGRADAVVVGSEHERLLLLGAARVRGRAWADRLSKRLHVVPLPIEAEPLRPGATGAARPADGPASGPGGAATDPVVATLGYLYPGKGVEEVVRAVGRLTTPPEVVNLGRAAAGHEDLVPATRALAEGCGVAWSTTGWLDDPELLDRLRSVTVPVAAHRHVSASGSLASWLAAGRRPVVLRSRYVSELVERLPGTLHVVDPGADPVAALTDAIGTALRDPARTWLAAGTRLGPGWEETAQRLVAVVRGVA